MAFQLYSGKPFNLSTPGLRHIPIEDPFDHGANAAIDSRADVWYDTLTFFISRCALSPCIPWVDEMQDDEIILSPAKYKELEADLERLSTVERKAIADRIKEARAMGDLSENFDYHDAKRQQGFLEGKIRGLKMTLERAKISDYSGGGDVIALGSSVKLHDAEFDEDIEYTIVGVMEADPSQDKISNTSPVGKALLGHRVGDRVEVQIPAGKAVYEIVEVR
jgi:transcription elongation factor GreA